SPADVRRHGRGRRGRPAGLRASRRARARGQRARLRVSRRRPDAVRGGRARARRAPPPARARTARRRGDPAPPGARQLETVVWENNRECWHCEVGHPQYVRANYDIASTNDAALEREIAAQASATSARLEAHGLAIDHREAGMVPFPRPGEWWSINRTPLIPG